MLPRLRLRCLMRSRREVSSLVRWKNPVAEWRLGEDRPGGDCLEGDEPTGCGPGVRLESSFEEVGLDRGLPDGPGPWVDRAFESLGAERRPSKIL